MEIARSTSEAELSEVTGVDVDSRGRIYVADWFAARVAVLDSAGALLRTLGRKGLGPGEFRGIRGVQVLPGDSLLVYDPNVARLSVFAPDADAPAHGLNLGAALNGPAPFLVRRAGEGGSYLALFRPPFMQGDTARRMDRLQRLNADGSANGAPLRSYPSKAFLHVRQQGGFSVMPHPFGREALFALGPRGELHVVWNDSARVETIDASGRPAGGFAVPYRPPEVSRADVDAAVEGMPDQAVRTFRPALEDSLPERWPAVRALLSDDEGRLWLGFSASAGEDAEWARFDSEGRYYGSVFLPRETDVRAIRAGRLYAVEKDADDAPAIVVYRINAPAAGGNG